MTKGANRPIGPWPIRSLELSLPGLFDGLLAPWPIRPLILSLAGFFAPGRESSMELSFAPLMCLSPCTL